MRRMAWFAAAFVAAASCDSASTSQGSRAAESPGPTVNTSSSAPQPPVSPSIAAAPSTSASPEKPSPDAARDDKIRQRFGDRCRLERACGGLWGIDCDAAVDGPYYYVKPDSLEVVSRCGGYCMGGRCTNCPPKEWSCSTY